MVESEFSLSYHLSQRVQKRKAVSHFSQGVATTAPRHPHPIALSGGCPNYGLFPVDSLTVNLLDKPFQENTNTARDFGEALAQAGNDAAKSVKDIYPSEHEQYRNKPASQTAIKAVIAKDTASTRNGITIRDAFQYQAANGFPQVLQFTRDLVSKLHKPARTDWDSILTNGGGDGLSKIFSLFVDPGDTVLVEEFTFTPTVWSIEDNGGSVCPVELDFSGDGIVPVKLESLLDGWAQTNPGKRKPRVLYTIATGQNPTGLSQSLETRKKVYAVAQKHDLVIVEDDPYGYIILPKFDPEFRSKESPFDGLSVEDYANNYINKSYLHIDVDGRVVRSESFSKLIAPGVRLGFVLANKFFIDKILKYTSLTTKFPSGAAQAIVNSVLQYWGGVDGYLKWGIEISKVYEHRRSIYYETLRNTQNFANSRISIVEATAGMFITILLNFPETRTKTYAQLLKELGDLTAQYGVEIVIAGDTLAVTREVSEKKGNHIRTTFVSASNDDEEIIEAASRLDKSITQLFINNGFIDA